MEIILVRHGESEFNIINNNPSLGRLYTGQYATPLTEKGKMQAKSLKSKQLFENLDSIYSSNLSRAIETAYLVTEADKIIQDTRLSERSLGIFEGKYEHELVDYKEFIDTTNFSHSFTDKAPNGENYTEVLKRVTKFFSEFDFEQNKSAIFSHYCCMRVIIMLLTNLTQEETLQLKIKNCQPIVLKGTSVGNFKITPWADKS